MIPGAYIIIRLHGEAAIICQVDGLMPGWAVLTEHKTGERLYYANDRFYREPPTPNTRALPRYTAWIDVPEYLESQVLSNSMLEWAYTKFNELAEATL